MRVEGSEERHGSLKTYVGENSIRRERLTTHHKVSNMFDEAHKGNKFKLVRSYNTATNRPGCSLNNTINCARQIEDMISKTLGIDGDDILDDDKKQQTLNRLSAMHESTYQEDVKN